MNDPCTSQATHDADDPALFCKLKLAAAIAVIRTKPPTMTGEEYAQQLAKQEKQREESWKDKAQKLERELLQTRQELVKSKLRQIDEDGNCTDAAMQEGLQSQAPVFPTPPSSSDTSQSSKLETLQVHARFLHSILTVQHRVKDLPLLDNCDVALTMRDSTLLCIETIRGCLRELSGDISIQKMKFAVENIVTLLESRIVEKFHREIHHEVMEFVKDILDFIYNSTALNHACNLEELSRLVIQLSHDAHLQQSILKVLVSKVTKCSCELRTFQQEQTDWNPFHFENSYFLFSMLEDILSSVSKNRRTLKSLPESLLTDLHTDVEDSLLHISDVFPLFAHYAWRITAILENLTALTTANV